MMNFDDMSRGVALSYRNPVAETASLLTFSGVVVGILSLFGGADPGEARKQEPVQVNVRNIEDPNAAFLNLSGPSRALER